MSARTASGQRPAGRTAPSVVMRLLGHFELRVGGRRVALSAGPQRLTAYLAVRGPTSRSRLAGELWPEATQDRAMGRLRTAIWRVNQTTHGLVCTHGGVLDLDPRADVDVRRVLLSAESMLHTTVSPLHAAPPPVELLPTWDDAWLHHERERVRQLQLHVLETGAERLMAEGSFGLALEWAFAAMCADPLRESPHRSVIRIHLAEGNVTEARRAYDACADLFRRELGVRPSPRTVQLLLAAGRDAVVTAP